MVSGRCPPLSAGLLVGAEQLYIRNRPFRGEVVRQGGKTWVEIDAFAKALDLRLEGDPKQGYLMGSEGEVSPPGEGRAILHAEAGGRIFCACPGVNICLQNRPDLFTEFRIFSDLTPCVNPTLRALSSQETQ